MSVTYTVKYIAWSQQHFQKQPTGITKFHMIPKLSFYVLQLTALLKL